MKAIKRIRTVSVNFHMPKVPGDYFWDTWDAVVEVAKRGNSLYVTPPARTSVEIRVSLATAGKFYPI